MIEDNLVLMFGSNTMSSGVFSVSAEVESSDRESLFPIRIVLPDDVAPHFHVTEVRVGLNSQLISIGAVPGELFAESGPCFDLLLDECSFGTKVTVCAQSRSGEARKFGCWVWGKRLIDAGSRKVVLGYGSTNSRGSLTVNVEPQRPFRPTHLFLPSEVGRDFTVESIEQSSTWRVRGGKAEKVDLDPSEMSKGVLGKAVSTSAGSLVTVRMSPSEVVRPGRFLTLRVCGSDRERTFRAAIVGDPV